MTKLTMATMTKYDKQHIGDVGRRTSDSSDPQERCDQPNNEKCHGPVQHDNTSLDRNLRRTRACSFRMRKTLSRIDTSCSLRSAYASSHNRLEMEVEACGDHVAVVVEVLVFDVLVFRLDILQPNVPVRTVDRDMVVEENEVTSLETCMDQCTS